MFYAIVAGGLLAILVSFLLRDRPSSRTWIGVAGILVVLGYVFFKHGGLSFDTIISVAGNPQEMIPCAGLFVFGAVLLASAAFYGLFERVAPD